MAGKWHLPLVLFLVLVMISLPYLAAVQANNAEYHFGGFLINPVDGHSYLAKMRQGFLGDWRFVLPYTEAPGQGAYLFVFYLALGHISRILNLPLALAFHLSRIAGAMFLLVVMDRFFQLVFRELKYARAGLWIAALGSGLGWIAALGGQFTSDFWVAEAYPFLSMYTSPHFTVGLGLLIISLLPAERGLLVSAVLGLVLAAIQPFGAVIGLGVLAFRLVAEIWEKQGKLWTRIKGVGGWEGLVGFGIGAAAVLIYQYWSILKDPILAAWNLQNQTPSPSLGDLILSFSPVLAAALLGVGKAWKWKQGRELVLWAGMCLALIFVPWNLQRRFMTGLYLPLAGLAVFGLKEIAAKTKISFRTTLLVFLVLSVPTNLLVIISGISASRSHDPAIFQPTSLLKGLGWIEEFSGPDDIILVNAADGLLVPSLTGRKVIYGHPFETVQASKELAYVESFFSDPRAAGMTADQLRTRGIDYILVKLDDELKAEDWIEEQGWLRVYASLQVAIYQVGQDD